jgi:hypothetical protein
MEGLLMNPVREAIIDRLENDATLATVATAGVHWFRAPQGTLPPFVIVQRQAGTRMHAFDGPPIRNEVYFVKGVGFADDAEAMSERCEVLLDDYGMTVDGRDLLLKPMPESDVEYSEAYEGETYQHVGVNYRIETEAS